MKKTALLIIALCLVLSCLSGCSGEAQNSDKSTANDGSVVVSTDPPQEDAPEAEPGKEPATEPEKEKIVLKLGGVGCNESKIKMVINEFNKTDSDYTISLMDYGFGTTPDQGKMRLQAQIMAGNRPDMLLFDSGHRDLTNALSPLAYISSGILLNLDEFVQNDPNIIPDDFIIWDALHEFNGMYLIGPKFWVNTLCCLPETAEQYRGWSLDDYLALQASLSSGQKLMYYITPEWFVRDVGSLYLHEAVDVENGSCDFENPDFISLLNAARQIQVSITEEEHMQADGSFKSAQEMLMDGDLFFFWTELDSAFNIAFDRYCSGGIRIWYGEGESPYQDRTGGTEPLAYIGYPTPDGSNGMFVELPYAVGICAGTEKADGCWEFIRFMLENQMYQDVYDGTPVLESELAENLEFIVQATEKSPWDTEKADQDVLIALAKECDKMSYYDVDILTIIEEEAAEFLAGDITAEQAAARVQNRASVLVMERYG